MSRQETIKQFEMRIQEQKDRIERIKKKREGSNRVHAFQDAIEDAQNTIQMLEHSLNRVKNYKPKTQEEWLQDVINKIDKRPDRSHKYYQQLRADYVGQLERLRAGK